MKILNIHATLPFNKSLIKKIKIKNFKVVATIQYLEQIKQYFPKAKQILGCSKLKKANTYLYIGTGKFHPLRLTKYAKEVYILNPETEQFYKLRKKPEKTKLAKFYSANNYGILVSTKPGQYKLNQAIKIKNKLKKPAYIFLTDNINTLEFENFPQINCWINTACPRIEHKKIINLEDLPIKI